MVGCVEDGEVVGGGGGGGGAPPSTYRPVEQNIGMYKLRDLSVCKNSVLELLFIWRGVTPWMTHSGMSSIARIRGCNVHFVFSSSNNNWNMSKTLY